MIEVRRTAVFAKWFNGLTDERARDRIALRIARIEAGLFGDVKRITGGSLFELRVDYGPGYRVYFARRGDIVVILLCGGEKRSQDRDIKRAKALEKEV